MVEDMDTKSLEIGRDDWIRTSDPLNPIHRDESQVSVAISHAYRWLRRKMGANLAAEEPDDLATERRYQALVRRIRGRQILPAIAIF